MAITYTKLKSGSWGIRSTEALREGASITVTKKDGSTKLETVGKIVWSGGGVWLATTSRSAAPGSSLRRGTSRGRRTGCSCGSIEDTPRPSDCRSCQFENFDQ